MAGGRDALPVGETASSGVAELDAAFGGIYWGDNVVWELEEGASVEPFYRAIGRLAEQYDSATFVATRREPAAARAAFPGFDVIDARPGSPTYLRRGGSGVHAA